MAQNVATAPLDAIHESEQVDIGEGVDAGLTDSGAEPAERREGLVDSSARVRDIEQVDGFGDAFETGGAVFRGGGAKQVERLPGGTFDGVGDDLAGRKEGESPLGRRPATCRRPPGFA